MNFLSDSGILQILALLFGLLAWVFALVSIFKGRRMKSGRWSVLTTVSGSCCALALWFPYLSTDLAVRLNDLAEVADCAWTYDLCAGILVAVTLILNVAAILVNNSR